MEKQIIFEKLQHILRNEIRLCAGELERLTLAGDILDLCCSAVV